MARQWCGRLGKKENCQLGVFLAYPSSKGHAPLDRQLYLPKPEPTTRRAARPCHVPNDLAFKTTWEIAADLLLRSGACVPHGWVNGDEELGRPLEFRERLRKRGERYILEVPCNITIRDPAGERPAKKPGRYGKRREIPFCRAEA